MDALPTQPLVPDRECGSCNVCCVALTIDDPAMQKLQGIRCRNALPDHRCAIYDARPQTCRTYFCGWRQLKWIRPTLRPDTSGVLVRLQHEPPRSTYAQRIGVIFTLLTGAALKAEGLAESVAAGVAAEVPVYLAIPGPPGYTGGQAQINDALRDAVFLKDKAEVLRILQQARTEGRKGKPQPIILKRPPPTR